MMSKQAERIAFFSRKYTLTMFRSFSSYVCIGPSNAELDYQFQTLTTLSV